MTDNEARARELANWLFNDFPSEGEVTHIAASLSAAERRGRTAGLTEARAICRANSVKETQSASEIEFGSASHKYFLQQASAHARDYGAIDACLAALSPETTETQA